MDTNRLIDDLGGSKAVAQYLRTTQSVVGNWRQRGVPLWARAAMAEMCEEKSIDHEGILDDRLPPRRAKVAA